MRLRHSLLLLLTITGCASSSAWTTRGHGRPLQTWEAQTWTGVRRANPYYDLVRQDPDYRTRLGREEITRAYARLHRR